MGAQEYLGGQEGLGVQAVEGVPEVRGFLEALEAESSESPVTSQSVVMFRFF